MAIESESREFLPVAGRRAKDLMADDQAKRVEELVEQHGQMVFATAYRILGRAEDAEDALQDVFLKLLSSRRARGQQDGVQNWGGYLRAVATRTAIDLLRRRRSWWRRRRDEVPADLPAPADDNPRTLASRDEKARLLRQALARLPKRDARVFAMRYFEDFSYEEIAAHTGMSTSQVGVILHRGRGRLQKFLGPLLAAEMSGPAKEAGKESNHVSES